MSDILHIIEKYKNQTGSYLNHSDLVQDIQSIQNMMNDLSKSDQNIAQDFFKSVITGIKNEIADLKDKLSGKGEALEKAQKIADACLAYSKQTGREG